MPGILQQVASFHAAAGGGGGSAPVFDAATTTTSSGNGVITLSHTCTGSDRILFVAIGSNSSLDATGVTYNGVAMTSMGAIDNPDSGANSRLEVFRLVAPATGANDISASFSGPPADRTVIAVSFTGVHQTVPLGTIATNTTNNTTAPTVTVVGAVGDLIVDFHAANSRLTSIAADASQTERASILGTGSIPGTMSSTEAGAASVVMNWSNSGSRWYSSCGVAIKPV
jgi:hypothetical protein